MNTRQPASARNSRRGITRLEIVLVLLLAGMAAILVLNYTRGRRAASGESASAQPSGQHRDAAQPPESTAAPAEAEAEGATAASGAESEFGRSEDVEGVASNASRSLLLALSPEARQSILDKFSAAVIDGKPDWNALNRLIASVQPDEMAAALQFIMDLPWSKERDEAMKLLMQHMATLDPVMALELAQGIPSRRQRQAAIDAVTATWAARDPKAAFAMLLSGVTPDGTPVKLNPTLLYAEMYRQDPEWALASLAELGDDRTREAALRGMFVVEGDPESSRRSLMEYFGAAQDPQLARAAAEVLVEEWGRTEPAEAAAWVETIGDPAIRSSAILELADQWARVAPDEAVAWLTAMDDAALAAKGAGRSVSYWQRDNPVGLEVWLRETPASPVRDSVAASYVDMTHWQSPQRAFYTAATISDPKTRTRLMEKSASSWARRDRSAATVAVLQSDLPDSTKQHYARKAAKPR